MEFKVGDKVRVIRTEFTEEEWKGIGKVPIKFNIGDEFEVTKVDDNGDNSGIWICDIAEYNYVYPSCGFELIKSEPEDMSCLVDLLKKINRNE